MTKPAEVIRQNAQIRWPGATVFERGRNYIVHRHPTEPDRLMVDSSIGALHYGAANDQEIDTTWIADTGAWQYRMMQAGYNVHARDYLNAGNVLEYSKDGETVTFQPLGLNWVDNVTDSRQQIAIPQAVQAQASDDTLYWPDGYGTGRHFKYRTDPTRLAKQLIIDSAAFVPAPTVSNPYLELEFIFSFSAGVSAYLEGVAWDAKTKLTTTDRIEFRTTGGAVLWVFDFPMLHDALNRRALGRFQVRKQGANLFITVRWPKTVIDIAQFPIVLDPTVDESTGAAGDDGYHGISVGNCNDLDTAADSLTIGYESGWQSVGAFVRFTDIAITTGATIDTAYLTFKAWETDSATTCAVTITAEDAATPAAPTTCTNIDNRTDTTASTNWTVGSWTENTDYNSDSIVGIIQELVDSYASDYNAGTADALFYIRDNSSSANAERRVSAYGNYKAYAVPRLHVEYSAGGSGSVSAVVATGTADGLAPTLTSGSNIVSAVSTATADGLGPVLSYGQTVVGAVSTATADGLGPDVIGHIAKYLTADQYVGSWTGDGGETSNLYTHIDETPASDTDYVQSELSPAASAVVFKLDPTIDDPLSSNGHSLSYRYQKDLTGGDSITLTVQLRQDYVSEASLGTLIAEWIHTDIDAITQADQTLSTVQADTITDYAGLYIRAVANVV